MRYETSALSRSYEKGQMSDQRAGGWEQSGASTTYCRSRIASVAMDRKRGNKSATTVLIVRIRQVEHVRKIASYD